MRRKILAAILATCAIALTIGTTIYAFGTPDGSSHSSSPIVNYEATGTQRPSTATPQPITVTLPTGTATPQSTISLQGWMRVTVPYAMNVVFAQSDPLTGYACGNMPDATDPKNVSAYQNTLTIGITHDGGHSWVANATNITSFGCSLQINPLNPQELVMQATQLCPCSDTYDLPWYRSLSGGLSWQELTPPTGNGNVTVNIDEVAWAGSSLFMYVRHFTQTNDGLVPAYQLAISTNGGALSWLNLTSLATYHIGPPYIFDEAVSLGATLVLHLDSAPGIAHFIATSDQGKSWQYVTASGVVPDTFTVVSVDGKTLYGQTYNQNNASTSIVQSIDGGHTFTSIATIPDVPAASGQTNGNHLFFVPDGTILNADQLYTQADGNTIQLLISEWSPSTHVWQTIIANGPGLTNVSWTPSGHPLALWYATFSIDGTGNNITPPGLMYHAPA